MGAGYSLEVSEQIIERLFASVRRLPVAVIHEVR